MVTLVHLKANAVVEKVADTLLEAKAKIVGHTLRNVDVVALLKKKLPTHFAT